MYIGTYIRYLSEEKLFSIISGQWQADELFRGKMKSGQLHSDRYITVKIENTDSGYRAFLESGTGFHYIWPKHPYTGIVLFYSYFPLMMIFTLLFSRSYLEIYRFMPLMNRYVLVLVILLAVFLPVIFIVPFEVQKILFSIIFIFDYIYYLPLFVPAGIAVYKKTGTVCFCLLLCLFISFPRWNGF